MIVLPHEEPDAFRRVLAETLEDVALADAIREGQTTDLVERDVLLALLERRG